MATSSGEMKTTHRVSHDVDSDATNPRHESNQLLYSEKFGECYKEDRLQILGSKKCLSSQLKTQRLPQSSVLSQIKAFLPELSKSNVNMAQDLKTNPELADSINIESMDDHAGDDNSRHIEMNLSLVPSELLSDSDSGDTSDESSLDDDSDQDEKITGGDEMSATESSVPSLPSLPVKQKDADDWLKLPRSSKKCKKGGNSLIKVVEEGGNCDGEDFTNR